MNTGNDDRRGTRAVRRRRHADGFTLVEVSLALGLAAFALVAILGTVPTGLNTVQDAVAQEVASSIAQQTQATLQQLSFGTLGTAAVTPAGSFKLSDMVSPGTVTRYYTSEGVDVTVPASTTAPPDAYFRVTINCTDPSYPDSTVSYQNARSAGSLPSSQAVIMTFAYPQVGAAPGPKKFVYSFLLARQRLN